MRRDPDDRALDRSLADLPEVGASDGFAERVFARLATRRRRRTATWTAALAAAGVLLAWVVVAPRPPRATPEHLRATHAELERELEQLRSLAAERSAVLYLGSTERYDLVLDLATLDGRIAPRSDPEYRPATLPIDR